MAQATALFTLNPTSSVEGVALSPPYDNMAIDEIELDIIKVGAYDISGRGYSNGTHQTANYNANSSTSRKSGYSVTKCAYVQEFNGSTWNDKIVGTSDISVPGEITFSFTSYDTTSTYYIQGRARGTI